MPIVNYNQLSGGINFKNVDTLINDTTQNTQFAFIQNFTTYQNGGLTSVKGISEILTTITDTTPVIAMGSFYDETNSYLVYQKASGAIRFISVSGGPEQPPVRTGVTTPCKFVQFANRVVAVNGVNVPFLLTLAGSTDVTSPHPNWSNSQIGQPTNIAVHQSTRVIVSSKNSIYLCALGNPNDWTTANDAFFATAVFGDFTNITCIKDYGDVTILHSSGNNVHLLSGSTPDEFAIDPLQAPESCKASLGSDNANGANFFTSSSGIYSINKNIYGEIQFSSNVELSRNIRPVFESSSVSPIGQALPSSFKDSLLVSHKFKNELHFFVKTFNNTYFDGVLIFNFDNNAWEYRKTIRIKTAVYHNGNVYIASALTTGATAGQIYRDDYTASLPAGIPFERRISTPFITFGVPYEYKQCNGFFIRLNSQSNNTIIVNIYINGKRSIEHTRPIELPAQSSLYGSSIYGTALYSTPTQTELWFPLQFKFKTLKLEFVCNDPISDFQLLSLGFDMQKGDSK